MSVDLYAAWLTAGNNLQPIGAWLGGNWIWLVAAVTAAATAWWAVRRWIRSDRRQAAYDREAAWHIQCYNPPAIQTRPGSDSSDLLTCLNILGATEQTRKEKP